MKMTSKLANELMDNLACVAISAMGGVPMDSDNNITMTEEQMAFVSEYAKNAFIEILEVWEVFTGKEWDISE